MPKIRPISDLRNYTSGLNEVSTSSPVFLTKNGRGSFAIINMESYEEHERIKAQLLLLQELETGRKSGEEEGYIPEENFQYYSY